jgi:membrane fusion protein, multidrug efflux system
MKLFARFFILMIVGIIVFMFPAGCRKEQKELPSPPVVEVTEVIQKDVPIVRERIGTTDGLVNAIIRAQVTGYLSKQTYTEGDLVKKGQVLFEIDPRPFQAALDQAKGILAQLEAQFENARANLARVKPLAEENALSQKDLDDAIGAERSAKAAVVAAKAAVEKARLDLGFTEIISPIDGIAGLAKAQVGNLVGPTQTEELTTVSTIDPIKVYYMVNEQAYMDFMKMFPSEAAGFEQARKLMFELILGDNSLYSYKGKFYALDRQVDVRTGTVRVAALFPNPNSLLRPGQFVRIIVTIGTKKGALLVPQRAVNELQSSFQVAVVGVGNHVEIRTVKTGDRFGTLWVIEEGLKPGEKIVVEGVQKVKQGMTVIPKPFAPASTTPAGQETSPKPGEGQPIAGGR